jgi:hypothetical protein
VQITRVYFIKGMKKLSNREEMIEEAVADDKKIKKLLESNDIQIPHAQDMLRKIFSKKKVKGDEEKLINNFIQLLKDNGIPPKEIAEVLLPFADPTFDTTFKMLFGSKEHDDILISLLNNLLNLSGDKKITALEIITSLLNQLCKFSHKYLKFYPQILSKNEPWLHSNFGWA